MRGLRCLLLTTSLPSQCRQEHPLAAPSCPYLLLQIGTPAWFEQHDWLEQLNLQAHLNAQAHADEFVKEALVSHDRLTPLVQELLVAEVWVWASGRGVAEV